MPDACTLLSARSPWNPLADWLHLTAKDPRAKTSVLDAIAEGV